MDCTTHATPWLYRFPVYAKEIKNGAKLTVREGQAAVFIREGKIADVMPPGMYTIDGHNTPILSTLLGWKYGFESPFKAEVYFVATRPVHPTSNGARRTPFRSATPTSASSACAPSAPMPSRSPTPACSSKTLSALTASSRPKKSKTTCATC